MAAPSTVSIHNLNGTFVMNKKLSDHKSINPMLKMQGIPWLVRQAAIYSDIQVKLTQYVDDEGIPRVDQLQISTGGVRQFEPRFMNGALIEVEIMFWGPTTGFTKYIKNTDIEDDFLKQGWIEEDDGDVILDHTDSKTNGWSATQVWGFAVLDGERRHVRRIVSKKGNDVLTMTTVYDYKS
ncbi:Hypothetical predicted protein [Lecanosticta acicola]|uniref:Uncharacterized protein n=1 Tax=Lecanosticta acicola TaxID=111012 RepID=A0AAI9EAC7_9PEZI|nr:Hypothetical predicted protein [Lecanosticta acicola]